MPLSTIFQYIVVVSFTVLVEEKSTEWPQATDKLDHIILCRAHLGWVWFKLTALVVIGTDCTDSCKSNYHTITSTTIPEAFGRCLKTTIPAVDILKISHVIGQKLLPMTTPQSSSLGHCLPSIFIFNIWYLYKAIKFQDFHY